MLCKTCHYSLANLTEHRCPECGRAFDPNDPKTFETDRSRRKRTWRVSRAMALLAIALAATASLPFFVQMLSGSAIGVRAFLLFTARCWIVGLYGLYRVFRVLRAESWWGG